MGEIIESVDRRAIESLVDWWQVSGADLAVGERPRNWLRSVEALPTPTPQGAVAASTSEMPTDFAAFRQWLQHSTGLPMDRAGATRILPSGVEQSSVMVLGDFPDRDDSFGAEAATLLARMLGAIHIKPEAAYMATLSLFHSPGSRFEPVDLDRCADLARCHIRLAKPAKLILFGDGPARALIGEPLTRARGRVHRVEGVRTIATFHPRWLLQRPSDKALAWRDLLLLMSESE